MPAGARDHAYRPVPASQRRDGLLSLETRGPHAQSATARRRLPDLDDRQESALPARGEVLRGLRGDPDQPLAGQAGRGHASSSCAWPAQQGKPFFHHVNCTDPHRPFIGANGPDDLAGGDAPSRSVRPEEVRGVPGFLEDLPEVRREVAHVLHQRPPPGRLRGRSVAGAERRRGRGEHPGHVLRRRPRHVVPVREIQRLREQLARRADPALARGHPARRRGPRAPRLDARFHAHAARRRRPAGDSRTSTAVPFCRR